jgi:hypothetical protein
MAMRIRINNIECRFSQDRYEIIRWQPNCYYGKEAEYIEDGWKFSDGFYRRNASGIHENCFKNPETCYTIATLNYRKGEGNCDLTTVGNRLLELSKPERVDFFAVYEYAEDRIQEEELAREEEAEY